MHTNQSLGFPCKTGCLFLVIYTITPVESRRVSDANIKCEAGHQEVMCSLPDFGQLGLCRLDPTRTTLTVRISERRG